MLKYFYYFPLTPSQINSCSYNTCHGTRVVKVLNSFEERGRVNWKSIIYIIIFLDVVVHCIDIYTEDGTFVRSTRGGEPVFKYRRYLVLFVPG